MGRPEKDTIFSLSLSLVVISITLSMILFPEPSFKAAERGLTVWWDIVLPALLPFFIAAELLMGIGIVHFIGVLMEPLMRPIFNVPGTGAFTMAMGIASGYPWRFLSARLKEDGLATKTEAERLMCFCNTSDPLFMTGAVAVGMFRRTDLAIIIIAAHYLSALSVGVMMRFWKKGRDESPISWSSSRDFIVMRAYKSMRDAQRKQTKPFGDLLGSAVTKSINTLLMILGFMVLFSVIFEILKTTNFTGLLVGAISRIIPEQILPPQLYEALVSGFFEITIGCSLASTAQAPLIPKVAVTSCIIAWSGLSVHAQVAAVIQPSGLSIWPYSVCRLIQSLLAALYTMLIMNPFQARWTTPAFEPITPHRTFAWLATMGSATKLIIHILLGIGSLHWRLLY